MKSLLTQVFSMYKVSIKTALSSAMAYRFNFLLYLLIVFVSNLLMPIVTLLIYGSGAEIPGWTLYEALLFQSCYMLSTGLCSPFFFNMVWVTMSNIREGNYDLLLIKPCPVLITTMAFSFELDNVGSLLGGLTLFIFSVSKLPPQGLSAWLSFAYFILCAVLMLFGAICLMAAITFRWVGNSRIFEMFHVATGFGRYPHTIFPKWLLGILTTVFPIAALGFFPASSLLGGFKPSMLLIALPCALFAILGILVFQKMVGAYQSAGG